MTIWNEMVPVKSERGHDAAHRALHTRQQWLYAVTEYGAVGNNSADDTTALRSAIAAAGVDGKVYVPPGVYRFADTLTLACHLDVHPAAQWVYTGPSDRPAVVLSGAYRDIRLPKLRSLACQWSVEAIGAGGGVQIDNLMHSWVKAPYISLFDVGLYLTDSTGTGTAYNHIDLGSLYHNAVNLRIQGKPPAGWVNQNLFVGGSLDYNAAWGDAIPGTRHLEILQHSARPYQPNENNFLFLACESNLPEWHLFTQGNNSSFIGTRWEAGGGLVPPRIKIDGGFGNIIDHGGSYLRPELVEITAGSVRNATRPRNDALCLHSPDGKAWMVTVDDTGVLTAALSTTGNY